MKRLSIEPPGFNYSSNESSNDNRPLTSLRNEILGKGRQGFVVHHSSSLWLLVHRSCFLRLLVRHACFHKLSASLQLCSVLVRHSDCLVILFTNLADDVFLSHGVRFYL